MATTAKSSSRSSAGKGVFDLFVELIREWLLQIGVNVQLFVEIMYDEDLPLAARSLAASVLLYLRLPVDIISDKLRVLGLIDDVIIMITGLSLIVPLMPEDRKAYYRRKYESVVKIDDYVQILQSTLGALWDRLKNFVDNLQNRMFKKKTAQDVVQSEELREELHDKAMVFVADLGLSPDEIDSELAALPPPEKVIGLLGSGLDDIQKRDQKKDTPILSTSLLKRFLSSGNNQADESGETEN